MRHGMMGWLKARWMKQGMMNDSEHDGQDEARWMNQGMMGYQVTRQMQSSDKPGAIQRDQARKHKVKVQTEKPRCWKWNTQAQVGKENQVLTKIPGAD